MRSRILVVDDNPQTRGLLADWLTGAGYDCRTASESAEALGVAAESAPDAAIVATDLPGNDGMWLARHLRERTDDLGVILTADSPDFASGVAAMRLGVNDYLLLPCTRYDVLQAVDRALAWRSSTQRDRSGKRLLQEAISIARTRTRGVIVGSSSDAGGARDALLAILRTRLPETYEHSRRVAQIAGRIATGMRIAGPVRLDVEQAALLHDVGKVSIPDTLLEKDGPLTEEEVDFLRSHVSSAFEILSSLPPLQQLASIVVATHEHYDGSGYPSSLAGQDIPLPARIIAVADAYDVLSLGLLTREALSRDDVNGALVRCAGSHFDPDVVRAWLRVDEGPLCS